MWRWTTQSIHLIQKNEIGIHFVVNIFPKRIFNFNSIFFIHLKGDCVN